ncbi:hypothetical protein HFP72_32960 [Nocardiopsis sp. ARC36]
MHPQDGSGGPDSGGGQKADTARAAAGEVASTAKEQARSLAGEARAETGHVVGDVQDRLREEADNQTRKASGNLRQWSQELGSMAEHGDDGSPVGTWSDRSPTAAAAPRTSWTSGASTACWTRPVTSPGEGRWRSSWGPPWPGSRSVASSRCPPRSPVRGTRRRRRLGAGDARGRRARGTSLPRQGDPVAGEAVPPAAASEGPGRDRGSGGG